MGQRDKISKFLGGIDKLIEEGKYIKAEKFLKAYIDENEGDYYPIIRKLGYVLVVNGKAEEAIEVMQPLLNITDENYYRAIYTLAFAYANLGDYEKSLEYIDLYIKNPHNTSKYKLGTLKNLKTSILHDLEYEKKYGNLEHSIDSRYSETDALNHIQCTHGFDIHEEGKTYFSEEIDIRELFYKMKNKIKSCSNLKYVREKVWIRVYYFYYDSIGYTNNNKIGHVLAVVTTDYLDIITMYPEGNEIDTTNINELSEKRMINEHSYQKVNTRKSQIDKFNQRYGKMG